MKNIKKIRLFSVAAGITLLLSQSLLCEKEDIDSKESQHGSTSIEPESLDKKKPIIESLQSKLDPATIPQLHDLEEQEKASKDAAVIANKKESLKKILTVENIKKNPIETIESALKVAQIPTLITFGRDFSKKKLLNYCQLVSDDKLPTAITNFIEVFFTENFATSLKNINTTNILNENAIEMAIISAKNYPFLDEIVFNFLFKNFSNFIKLFHGSDTPDPDISVFIGTDAYFILPNIEIFSPNEYRYILEMAVKVKFIGIMTRNILKKKIIPDALVENSTFSELALKNSPLSKKEMQQLKNIVNQTVAAILNCASNKIQKKEYSEMKFYLKKDQLMTELKISAEYYLKQLEAISNFFEKKLITKN